MSSFWRDGKKEKRTKWHLPKWSNGYIDEAVTKNAE